MFENKNILIYPYSREAYALVSYLKECGNTKENIYVIAPGKSGIVGADAGGCFNLPFLGLRIENDFYAYMAKADIVVIVWSNMNEALMKKIELFILHSLQGGKRVVCCTVLGDEFLASLVGNLHMTEFFYLPVTWDGENMRSFVDSGNFYRAKIPVIFIGELMDGLCSFEILEKLTNQFRKNGYRVSAIGDKCYSELLKMKRMPEMKVSCILSEEGKVNLFNMLIHEIEEKEKPDIIFIQLPGAIMKYENKQTEAFGIVPFLLSLAIEADYMILCVPYAIMSEEFYEQLQNICRYRLSTELLGICMTNVMLDVMNSGGIGKREYLNISQKKLNARISDILQKSNIPLYNCYEKNGCNEICQKLEGLLSD